MVDQGRSVVRGFIRRWQRGLRRNDGRQRREAAGSREAESEGLWGRMEKSTSGWERLLYSDVESGGRPGLAFVV